MTDGGGPPDHGRAGQPRAGQPRAGQPEGAGTDTRSGDQGVLQFRLDGEREQDGLMVIDHAGRVQSMTRSAERLFGVDAELLVGGDVYALFEPGSNEAIRTIVHDLASSLRPSVSFEMSLDTGTGGTGQPVEFEVFAFTRTDDIVITFRNVSGRNRYDRRLRSTARHDLAITAAYPDGLMVVDTDGVVTQVNESLETMFGVPRSRLLRRRLSDLLDGAPAGVLPSLDLRHERIPADAHPALSCLRSGRRSVGTILGRNVAPGDVQWVQVDSQEMRGLDGLVSGSVTSFVDVSDIIRSSEALERSIDHLRSVHRKVSSFDMVAGAEPTGADLPGNVPTWPPPTTVLASVGSPTDPPSLGTLHRVLAEDHEQWPGGAPPTAAGGSGAMEPPGPPDLEGGEGPPGSGDGHRAPRAPGSPSWLRSASLLSLATVVISLGNYAFSLVAVHLLRPEDFSRFSAAQSVLLVLANGGMAAIPWAVAHYVVQENGPQARSEALSFGLRASALLSIAAAGVAELILIGVAGPAVASVAALGAALMFMVAGPVGYLQGTDRVDKIAKFRGVEAAVRIGSGLLVIVFVSRSAWLALIGFSLGAAVMLAISLLACRDGWPLHRPDKSESRKLIRQSVRLGAVQLAVVSLGAIDAVAVLASHFASQTSASYLAASLIGRIPLFISNAVAIAAFAALTAAKTDHEVADHLKPILRFYAVLTVPVVIGSLTVPHRLLFILIPSSYSQAPTLLKYLCVSGAAIGVINCVSTVHQARGRFKPAIAILVTAAVIQPVLLIGLGRTGGIYWFCTGLVLLSCVTAVVLTWDARRWLPFHRPSPLTIVFAVVTVVLGVASSRVHSPVVWIALIIAVTASTAAALLRRAAGMRTRPTTTGPQASVRAE